MSSTTLPTRYLVGLLEDAVLTTADPKMELPHLAAVLLGTDRGNWRIPVESDATDADDEPLFDDVTSDLLVGWSTNLGMVAQVHTACQGQLHKPILISRMDADAIVDVFKPLVSKRLPKTVTHQTLITASGGTVIVSEDPNQVPGGVSVTVTAMDLDPYPRNIAAMFDINPDQPVIIDTKEVPRSYGTGFEFSQLEVLAKVAKRRKMPIAMYQHHQRARIRVEIGEAYTVILQPLPLNEDNGQQHDPLIEVFTPDLPKKEALVKNQEPLVSA
jgi:hypothetical protein